VCLNIGCIPSKALIHQAEVFRSIPSLKEMGVTVDTAGLDYKKVFEKSRKAADALSKGVQFLLKKNKVEVVAGEVGIPNGRRRSWARATPRRIILDEVQKVPAAHRTVRGNDQEHLHEMHLDPEGVEDMTELHSPSFEATCARRGWRSFLEMSALTNGKSSNAHVVSCAP